MRGSATPAVVIPRLDGSGTMGSMGTMEMILILPVVVLIAGLAMAGWGWANDEDIRHQRR